MPSYNRFPSGASVEQLKKDAKALSRAEGIPLHESLNRTAILHGLKLPWSKALAALQIGPEGACRSPLGEADSERAIPKDDTCFDQEVLAVISKLNINGHLAPQAVAEGWLSSAYGCVVVLPGTLLDKFAGSENPPAMIDLVRSLKRLGVLVTSDQDAATESGLFSCRVGVKRYAEVFLLDTKTLDALLPGCLSRWGVCQFHMKVGPHLG